MGAAHRLEGCFAAWLLFLLAAVAVFAIRLLLLASLPLRAALANDSRYICRDRFQDVVVLVVLFFLVAVFFASPGIKVLLDHCRAGPDTAMDDDNNSEDDGDDDDDTAATWSTEVGVL